MAGLRSTWDEVPRWVPLEAPLHLRQAPSLPVPHWPCMHNPHIPSFFASPSRSLWSLHLSVSIPTTTVSLSLVLIRFFLFFFFLFFFFFYRSQLEVSTTVPSSFSFFLLFFFFIFSLFSSSFSSLMWLQDLFAWSCWQHLAGHLVCFLLLTLLPSSLFRPTLPLPSVLICYLIYFNIYIFIRLRSANDIENILGKQ